MRTAPRLALGIAAALALAACGGADASTTPAEEDPGLRIVATTSILGDVVTTLVGDDAEVEVLMGPGVDPHAFAPSAAQARSLREADLVVANGLGLEEALLDTLAGAAEDGVPVFELAPEVDPIEFSGTHDHDEDHEGEGAGTDDAGNEDHDEDADHEDEEHDAHDHDGDDPHVWFDPLRMADGVELLAAVLAQADDVLDDAVWTERGTALADELRALDDELTALVATVPADDRVLVTNHGSFGYLAARHGFEIVGTVVPGASTQAEASAREFAELAELLQTEGVRVVFAEAASPDRVALALAEEVGEDVAVVQLYSDALGPEGSGAETYTGLLRTTVGAIVDALT